MVYGAKRSGILFFDGVGSGSPTRRLACAAMAAVVLTASGCQVILGIKAPVVGGAGPDGAGGGDAAPPLDGAAGSADAGIGNTGYVDAGPPPVPGVIVKGLTDPVFSSACEVAADGTLHVAYATAGGVFYVADSGSGPLEETIATGISVGGRVGLTLHAGQPWVSYVDATSSPEKLTVAHRDGTWMRESISTPELASGDAPIVDTPAGLWLGMSVYQTTMSGNQAYVTFVENGGTGWGSIRYLLSGEPLAAAVDSLGLVHLTMYGGSTTVPTYLATLDDQRSKWVQHQIGTAGDTAGTPDIALDSADRPHVVYDNGGQLLYAYSPMDGVWKPATIEGTRTDDFAIAVRPDDVPIVAYYTAGGTDDVRFATRSNGSFHLETLDADGDVGKGLSMALDGTGLAHIVYYDATRQELKVVVR